MFLILNIFISLILCEAFDNQLLIIKGFIFAQILIFAAYHDVKTRELPNLVHIFIILTAFITINPLSSIYGLIIVPLPFLVVALLKEGSIGGGDIKLMGACGFLLGTQGGIFASIIGLTIAIIHNYQSNKSFPLAPYLSIGCFAAYLIFQ